MTKSSVWQTYLLHIINGDETGFGAFFIRIFLTGLEFIYRMLSGLKYITVHRRRLPVSVISIGNITVGGTGKTPTVIWLTRLLKEAGLTPAVLTRGYGGSSQKSGLILTNHDLTNATPTVTGDEPFLLAKLLPDTIIAVGRERYQNALRALTVNPGINIFILDDGFQHWGLKRNLDIIVIDASRPFSNKHLLPRGFLREPLSSLKRAGVILLTRTAKVDDDALIKLTNEILTISPKAALSVIEENTTQLIPLPDFISGRYNKPISAADFLKGRKVSAVTGIGNPRQFLASLENLGAEVGYFKAYPDHYHWEEAEIIDLIKGLAESDFSEMIITAKDAVKLGAFVDFYTRYKLTCYVLSLDFAVPNQQIIEKVKAAAGLLRVDN